MAKTPQQFLAPRKIAHIRTLGGGQPGWGETQTWSLPGYDPSISVYDHAEGSENSNLSRSVAGNVTTIRGENRPTNPSTTRDARFSQFSSMPAARFFQGYFSVGFSWLAPELNLVGSLAHQPLNVNWNPFQPGRKELQPATSYDPYPPGGALWPKAI